MPKESFIYSLDDTDAAARPFLQYARDYVAHLGVERGSSRLTLAAYESDLRDYFAFLLGRGVLAPCDVSRADIVAYESDLVERGYAASTISRRVSAVKGFHRFLVSDELVQTNPAESISLPQRPDRLPDALSVAQINALLDQPFGKGPRAQRDKAMLEILYGCGLRASELVGLDMGCIDFDGGVVRVLGKGSRERFVPISGTAETALKAYAYGGSRAELSLKGKGSPAVFLNARGARMTRQAVHRIVAHAGEAVGIADLHPHMLRHSRPICSRAAPICAPFKKCLGIPIFQPRKSTRMSAALTFARNTFRHILAHSPNVRCATRKERFSPATIYGGRFIPYTSHFDLDLASSAFCAHMFVTFALVFSEFGCIR